MKFVAAAVQMVALDDKAVNLAEADRWVRQAALQGAKVVALPEVFIWRGSKKLEHANAEPVPGPTSDAMAVLAAELKIYLLAGSILEEISGSEKAYNTSLLFDPQDEPARNNLLAAHNNWALALCDAGELLKPCRWSPWTTRL